MENNMSSEVTNEELARMIAKGFEGTPTKQGMNARFDEVNQRLDKVDERLEHIEKFLLEDHRRRIEKLEEKVQKLEDLLAIK